MLHQFMIKNFECEICDYICFQKGALTKHFALVHEESKPFNYEICDYGCTEKARMTKHIQCISS